MFLLRYLSSPAERATAIASSFAASLEMVREGELEVRQDGAFAPLYIRARQRPAADTPAADGAAS
jgi:segregation and condensation protein A